MMSSSPITVEEIEYKIIYTAVIDLPIHEGQLTFTADSMCPKCTD